MFGRMLALAYGVAHAVHPEYAADRRRVRMLVPGAGAASGPASAVRDGVRVEPSR